MSLASNSSYGENYKPITNTALCALECFELYEWPRSVHSVLCTKWGGGICTDHGTDRGPLREREIEEDRERERKRERDREIEHFSGARPRREYEWLIARAAASGRELRAFVCVATI